MGVGVFKKRGLWVDASGHYLPADRYGNVRPVLDDEGKELKGVIRIDNPYVARDKRKGSYTFKNSISRLAARRFTNKNKKARNA